MQSKQSSSLAINRPASSMQRSTGSAQALAASTRSALQSTQQQKSKPMDRIVGSHPTQQYVSSFHQYQSASPSRYGALLSSKDYRRGDVAPRLGPFQPKPQFSASSRTLQHSVNTTSRRPFTTQTTGLLTRQERLRTPYYRKPVHMELGCSMDADKLSQGSSGSLVQFIKTGVTNLFNRMMGRSQDQQNPSDLPKQQPRRQRTVLVSDVQRCQPDAGFDSDFDDEKALEKVAASTFMNIAKVDHINYYSGKSSSHARAREQSSFHGNELSMESSRCRSVRQHAHKSLISPRPESAQLRVEQSRFIPDTSQREVGLKRSYLDMNPKQNLVGDLSQIKDASNTINEEVVSDEDFVAVSGALSVKRQHVSMDPKEQSEAERQRMMKLFEPILEKKMAEQIKSNEAMLERFKDSMLEVIHEQSNMFLSHIKNVVPAQSTSLPSQPKPQQQPVPGPPALSRGTSQFNAPPSADQPPSLQKSASIFNVTGPKNEGSSVGDTGKSTAMATKTKEQTEDQPGASFLKPPSQLRQAMEGQGLGEKAARSAVNIQVVVPPKVAPENQDKKLTNFGAQGQVVSLFDSKPDSFLNPDNTKKETLCEAPPKPIGSGFAVDQTKKESQDANAPKTAVAAAPVRSLFETTAKKEEKPESKPAADIEQKKQSLFDKPAGGTGLFGNTETGAGGLFQVKPATSTTGPNADQLPQPVTKGQTLFAQTDAQLPSLQKSTSVGLFDSKAISNSAPPAEQKSGVIPQLATTMEELRQKSPFDPKFNSSANSSQKDLVQQAAPVQQTPQNPFLSATVKKNNPFMQASQPTRQMSGSSQNQNVAGGSQPGFSATNSPPREAKTPFGQPASAGFALGTITGKTDNNQSSGQKAAPKSGLFGAVQPSSSQNLFGLQQSHQQPQPSSGQLTGFGSQHSAQPAVAFGANAAPPAQTSIFGQNLGQKTPSPAFGHVGSVTTAQPATLFGQQPAANSMGLFGNQQQTQAVTSQMPGSTSLFGQAQHKPTENPLFGKMQAASNLFGQQQSLAGQQMSLFGAQTAPQGQNLFEQKPLLAPQGQLFPNKQPQSTPTNDGLFRGL